MTVTLSEIFVKKSGTSLYSRDELGSLTLKKEFIKRLSQYYDIPYMMRGTKENNLCYANSSTIRFAYKPFFSEKDIVFHLLSSLEQDTFDINSTVVTFV
ncbi:hypothetical protein [Flagellimonas aurea]|uniref:hypothetical protein n=1 Tax=Flagellimonas aurea TaxID=2915619 RepID=UPI0035D00A5D